MQVNTLAEREYLKEMKIQAVRTTWYEIKLIKITDLTYWPGSGEVVQRHT